MWVFLNQLHRFLIRHALYSLSLATFLAIVLIVGRVYLSRNCTYCLFTWNLFLAWIPYLISLWLSYMVQNHASRWWVFLSLGAVWLVFFPNAPYIITDFWHLEHRPPVPFWYDLGLIATFAWTGLFLAIFSLRAMQMLVNAWAGVLAGWLFVAGVIGLTGLGVYLGRFLNWNSWDLLFHPQAILADIAVRLVNPLSHLQTFGFTFLFAGFLLICYLTIMVSPVREQS